MNGYGIFGILIAALGVLEILMAKRWGVYARDTWARWGSESLTKTPEYWAKVARAFGVLFIILGVCVAVVSTAIYWSAR